MSYRTAAGIMAALLLAVGLALGLWPHSVPDGTPGGIGCGSAFSSTNVGAAADAGAYLRSVYTGTPSFTNYAQQCSDALAGPRTAAWVLTGVGSVAGLFLLLVSSTRVAQVPAPAPQGEDERTGL